jgi:uncharacterized protein (TIGR02246 family)
MRWTAVPSGSMRVLDAGCRSIRMFPQRQTAVLPAPAVSPIMRGRASRTEAIMRSFALVVGCLMALAQPALAQKAEIEAANGKWIEFFNKGDFAGVASLYTEDAAAFPPGSAMVKGRAAIAAMWKSIAEQLTDPQLTTLEVKSLGPAAAREIGTFSLKTKGPTPKEVSGKYVVVWEKVGADWKLAADIWNEGK